MPEFSFKVADASGRSVEGRLEAGSRDEALRSLLDQGLTPLRIDETRASGAVPSADSGQPISGSRSFGFLRQDRPTRSDVLAFTSELAVMLRAGLSLDGALRVLLSMQQKPAVATLLSEVLESVKRGVPLSRALSARGDLFETFYVNMVRSGEASGQLGAVLARLVEHLERMRALRDSVVSALIYPAIVLAVAFLSVVGILVFVVPQFETLFRDMREALPLSTRLVLGAAQLFTDHGLSLLICAALVGIALTRWLRSKAGQLWWQARLASLPLLGRIVREYNLARFARTYGTLLSNGVPILPALGVSAETVSDSRLRDAIEGIVPAVKSGGRIADALQRTGYFEPLAVNLVRVGEETGALDRMMLELAAILDRKVESGVKRGLTLLEPMLILGLGLVVAVLIISILLGILTVNELAVS